MMTVHWLLNLLFPPRCPFCGKLTDEHRTLCPACQSALPWTQGEEGEQTLPGGVRCASPLWYEGNAREGLLRYKFRGVSSASHVLGGLIADCAAERFSGEFDTVTWVPVGPKRLRSRGYDQSRLLAESACRRWDTQPEQLLYKPQDVPAQSGLSDPAARRANVLGVYEASLAAAGRRILLVDDVVTTGATLSECARVLRCAGALSVVCVTLAKTRPHIGTKKTQNERNT